MNTQNIDELLGQGWACHDTESERLASELESLPLASLTPAQTGALLKLSNHTMGEHLDSWGRARRFAESVFQANADAAANAAAWAYLAAARHLDDDAAGAHAAEMLSIAAHPDNPLAGYIEARIALTGALFGSLRFADGSPIYRDVVALRSTRSDVLPSDRALAIVSNNLASQLLEFDGRSANQTALMCLAATTALDMWRHCGTWENVERALYLMALVENAQARWEAALGYTREALALIDTHGGEPVDEAFIRLAAARSLAGLGQSEAHQRELDRADALAAAWQDASLLDAFRSERALLIAGQKTSP